MTGAGHHRIDGRSAASLVPPPPLPGFEHVKRFYNPKLGWVAVSILPGQYYVSTADELVTTLLGSCVAACIWDDAAGIGGMNHFTNPGPAPAPAAPGSPIGYDQLRYGAVAMEQLITTILDNGGSRPRLQVKLVGGGHVVASESQIGSDNVRFARQFVASTGLQLVGEHVEGLLPRKVVFHPTAGWAKVRIIRDRSQRRSDRSTLASGALELT